MSLPPITPSSSRLPDRELDPQVSVHSDGKQGHDGGVSEDQEQAGHEKAAVEVDCDAQADDNGQRHDQQPDRNVSQGQGDNEIEGGGLQTGVQLDHPDDQHVAHDGAEPNDNLHDDVHVVGQQHGRAIHRHLGFPEEPPRGQACKEDPSRPVSLAAARGPSATAAV